MEFSLLLDKARVGEGLEKGHQGGQVLVAELQAIGLELGVEGGALVQRTLVVGHRLFEFLVASVVHVGGGQGDVAETGSGKAPFVDFPTGGLKAARVAQVIVGSQAVVAELIVGELRTAVALEATGSAFLMAGEEELVTALLKWGQGLLSSLEAIVFRIGAHNREEVIFKREGEGLAGDGALAVGLFKIAAVALASIEVKEDAAQIGGHLEVILDGFEDLLADGGGPSVPEKVRFPGEVEEGRGIAFAEAAFKSPGTIDVVAKGELRHVTGRAGNGPVDGEDGVVEQALAQGASLAGQSVVGGEGWLGENGGLILGFPFRNGLTVQPSPSGGQRHAENHAFSLHVSSNSTALALSESDPVFLKKADRKEMPPFSRKAA